MTKPQLIACDNCGAEVQLPATASRDDWHCPECGDAVVGTSEEPEEEATYRIARPTEPSNRKPGKSPESAFKPTKAVPDEDSALYPLPASELDDRTGLQRRKALRVKTDAPPKHAFLSNVFEFPFQGSVIGQTVVLAAAFTVFGLLGLLIASLMAGANSLVSGVIAFIVLPAFWIGLWTFSYAAACSLIVIEETAAGNNEIREWMDSGWKEWVTQLFYLLYIACLPLAIAWPIVKLSGHTYAEAAIPLAIVEFFLFPIALLSALEQDSMWLPFSPPVLKSLLKAIGGWLKFYVTAAIVVGTCGATIYFSLANVSIALAFLVGPVCAAGWMIYSRLIGRLGWLIIDRVDVTRTRKPAAPSIPDEII